MRRLALIALVPAFLAACDSWIGETAAPPLPGKRISVLAHSQQALQSEAADKPSIILPPPEAVAEWPQAGGYPPHAMHHLELGDRLREVWSRSIGKGGGVRRALLTQPVSAEGKVFAMDARHKLSALALKDGERLWSADLAPDGDYGEGTYGGGIAYEAGTLYVTTGFDQLVAVSAADGKILWRRPLPAPVRGAPTVRGGRVFVITVENQTLALAADDGRELWHHNGIVEAASMVGGNSPAVDGNVVVVAYTSGEVFALRIENGTAIWNDVISGLRRTDQLGTLGDIRGLPIISDNKVFVASNSDNLAAIDLRSGRRVWDRDIGSIQTPWIAGDYLFIISNNQELICFAAKTGQIQWVAELPAWRNEKDKIGRVVWTGPVLASDRLIVASSEEQALAISPYTGEMLGKVSLNDPVSLPPIIVDNTLIVLTDDGDIVAYR